jgi:hypothetical protein
LHHQTSFEVYSKDPLNKWLDVNTNDYKHTQETGLTSRNKSETFDQTKANKNNKLKINEKLLNQIKALKIPLKKLRDKSFMILYSNNKIS